MNITPAIVEKLRAYDLSTEAAALNAYGTLSASLSPLLLSLIRYRRMADIRNMAQAIATERGKEGNMIHVLEAMREAMREIIAEEVSHYVTTRRSRINRITLREIKNRLGILLAKWEDEARKKAAGELPAIEGEGYGHIVEFATEHGLTFLSMKPDLSKKEIQALDLTAERVLHTFEAYILYALTLRPTSTTENADLLKDTELRQAIRKNTYEEVRMQWDALEASEWEENGDGLTFSFEQEAQFFADENERYTRLFLTHFLGADGGMAEAVINAPIERERDTSEEDAADRERAMNSRYKNYLKF